MLKPFQCRLACRENELLPFVDGLVAPARQFLAVLSPRQRPAPDATAAHPAPLFAAALLRLDEVADNPQHSPPDHRCSPSPAGSKESFGGTQYRVARQSASQQSACSVWPSESNVDQRRSHPPVAFVFVCPSKLIGDLGKRLMHRSSQVPSLASRSLFPVFPFPAYLQNDSSHRLMYTCACASPQ